MGRTRVRWKGRRLIYFGGCDYFRLSSDRRVLRALREGARRYGLNMAASRTTTGNHPLYERLETKLARFFGVERALLAPNGWAPSLMLAQAVAGQFSHVLIDETAHPSLKAAAALVGCPVLSFKHRDGGDFGRVVNKVRHGRPLVLTDGMFPRDGSVAPIGDYLACLPEDGLMLVDDAHAAGVLGMRGHGTAEHWGIADARVVQTITLSKAFGVFGGAVLGRRELVDLIKARSGLFVGSTPLPLPLANAALAALEILATGEKLRSNLAANTEFVRDRLRKARVETPQTPGPIIGITPKSRLEAERMKKRLLAAGIYPPFSRYPGGPAEGYFRFAISSAHSRGELAALAQALTGPRRTSPKSKARISERS